VGPPGSQDGGCRHSSWRQVRVRAMVRRIALVAGRGAEHCMELAPGWIAQMVLVGS